MKTTTAQRVHERLQRKEDLHVVDVLPEAKHRAEHIPDSVNVPLEYASFLQRIESLVEDKGAELIVYCADEECQASRVATQRLEEAGFENVIDLEGGLREWKDGGYPVAGQAAGD